MRHNDKTERDVERTGHFHVTGCHFSVISSLFCLFATFSCICLQYIFLLSVFLFIHSCNFILDHIAGHQASFLF